MKIKYIKQLLRVPDKVDACDKFSYGMQLAIDAIKDRKALFGDCADVFDITGFFAHFFTIIRYSYSVVLISGIYW